MPRLPSITCPDCRQPISSRDGLNTAPLKYADCLRQCEPCGNGFSNKNTDKVEQLTIILRDPFSHVPALITEGWEDVFAQALNETNRKSKHAKIASLNSEDHVTWTVFRYLILKKRIGKSRPRAIVSRPSSGSKTGSVSGGAIPESDTKIYSGNMENIASFHPSSRGMV